jgi:RimJ/RimL family protein N-acetyltransferase
MHPMRRASSMAETIAETARLRLRTWDDADIDPFMAALNTPAVMRWLGGVGDEALYRRLFERMQACQAANGYCFWIVERRADAQLLGFCGLYVSERADTPVDGMTEIGWRLREDAWGMGYAREAAEACLTLAFDRHALDQVVAYTITQNDASWGLMMRLGMIRAREYDHHIEGYDPEISDTIVYKIDRRDWTQ